MTTSERSLDWSPDGRLIAFVRGDLDDLGSSIYVVRPDGTGERRLSLLTPVDHPSWQPLPESYGLQEAGASGALTGSSASLATVSSSVASRAS